MFAKSTTTEGPWSDGQAPRVRIPTLYDECYPFGVPLVEDFDDKTPTVDNPCPRCGNWPMVIIGAPRVPPPEMCSEIWETVFAEHCVKAPMWQWCREGYLEVRIVPPDHHVHRNPE